MNPIKQQGRSSLSEQYNQHILMMETYMQRDNVEEALPSLDFLRTIDPDNQEVQYNLGIVYQHKGDIARAVAAFCECMNIDPVSEQGVEAANALEVLDCVQINQIGILSHEDLVFRTKLCQSSAEAARERGYTLSRFGEQMLEQLVVSHLSEVPENCRTTLIN